MKRILTFLLTMCLAFALAPNDGYSQVVQKKVGTETLTNVDTITIAPDAVPDGVSVLFQATVIKASGTLAGKIYLQRSLNGVDYENIDSLTLTNVARTSKIFSVTGALAPKYQIQIVSSSGTLSATGEVYTVRRRQ